MSKKFFIPQTSKITKNFENLENILSFNCFKKLCSSLHFEVLEMLEKSKSSKKFSNFYKSDKIFQLIVLEKKILRISFSF